MENLNSDIPMFSILKEGADHVANDNQVAEWDKKRVENEKENYFINKSNVGKKFLNKSLKDYVAETDEQKNILTTVNHFIKCVNDGKCRTLWLCGNTGTGKTLLGSSICRETMGTFCRSYNIKDDIDASKTFKATETKRMVIERYANYRLLVIDEVGRGGADERDYL